MCHNAIDSTKHSSLLSLPLGPPGPDVGLPFFPSWLLLCPRSRLWTRLRKKRLPSLLPSSMAKRPSSRTSHPSTQPSRRTPCPTKTRTASRPPSVAPSRRRFPDPPTVGLSRHILNCIFDAPPPQWGIGSRQQKQHLLYFYIEGIYFRFVELRNYFDTFGVGSKLSRPGSTTTFSSTRKAGHHHRRRHHCARRGARRGSTSSTAIRRAATGLWPPRSRGTTGAGCWSSWWARSRRYQRT